MAEGVLSQLLRDTPQLSDPSKMHGIYGRAQPGSRSHPALRHRQQQRTHLRRSASMVLGKKHGAIDMDPAGQEFPEGSPSRGKLVTLEEIPLRLEACRGRLVAANQELIRYSASEEHHSAKFPSAAVSFDLDVDAPDFEPGPAWGSDKLIDAKFEEAENEVVSGSQELKTKLSDLDGKLANLGARWSSSEQEKADLQNAKDANAREAATWKRKAQALQKEMEKEVKKLREEESKVVKLELDNKLLTGRVSAAESKVEELRANMGMMKVELKDHQNIVEDHKKRELILNKQADTLNAQLYTAQSSVEALKSQAVTAAADKQDLVAKLRAAETKIAEEQQRFRDAEQTSERDREADSKLLETERRQREDVERRARDAEEASKKLEEKAQELEQQLARQAKELQDARTALTGDVQRREDEVKKLIEENDASKKQLDATRGEKEQLQEQLAEAQKQLEEREHAKAQEALEKVLDTVSKEELEKAEQARSDAEKRREKAEEEKAVLQKQLEAQEAALNTLDTDGDGDVSKEELAKVRARLAAVEVGKEEAESKASAAEAARDEAQRSKEDADRIKKDIEQKKLEAEQARYAAEQRREKVEEEKAQLQKQLEELQEEAKNLKLAGESKQETVTPIGASGPLASELEEVFPGSRLAAVPELVHVGDIVGADDDSADDRLPMKPFMCKVDQSRRELQLQPLGALGPARLIRLEDITGVSPTESGYSITIGEIGLDITFTSGGPIRVATSDEDGATALMGALSLATRTLPGDIPVTPRTE